MIRSLRQFSSDIRNLPRVVGHRVAEEAAPAITELAQTTFASGEDAYGAPWAPGVDGHKITLRLTGDMEKLLVYVANGTKLRVKLAVPYAKYQIGKRPVFPTQDGALPTSYRDTLASVTSRVCREEIGPR